MSIRVFGIGVASVDEVNGVRQALSEAGIKFYETPPGSAGSSHGTQGAKAAAIWVAEEDAHQARQHINEFQEQWRESVRTEALGSQKPYSNIIVYVVMVVVVIIYVVIKVA